MIVALTGFMGCGKTRTASILAKKLGWESVDLDTYIEHKAGRSVAAIFEESEEYFRALEIEAVTDIVTMHRLTGENVVIALGGGTFTLEPARVQLLEYCSCVYLSAGADTLRERLATGGAERPLYDKSRLVQMLSEREFFYSQAPHTVATDTLSPEAVADKIIEKLCLSR